MTNLGALDAHPKKVDGRLALRTPTSVGPKVWLVFATSGVLGLSAGCTEDALIQPTTSSPDLGAPDVGRYRPDIGPLLRSDQRVLDIGPVVLATYGIGEINYENRTDSPLWLFTNLGPCPPLGVNLCVCGFLEPPACSQVPRPPYLAEPDEVSTLYVQFTPVGPGEEPDADLVIAGCNNDPDCSIEFDIRGYGVRSGFSCTEGLDFGSVEVGSEATMKATCRNIGNVKVNLDFFELIPEDVFALTSTVPEILNPSESFELSLSYLPVAEGPSRGSLYVESREDGRVIIDPPRIILSGEGVRL